VILGAWEKAAVGVLVEGWKGIFWRLVVGIFLVLGTSSAVLHSRSILMRNDIELLVRMQGMPDSKGLS
jgi:hypothetical protein